MIKNKLKTAELEKLETSELEDIIATALDQMTDEELAHHIACQEADEDMQYIDIIMQIITEKNAEGANQDMTPEDVEAAWQNFLIYCKENGKTAPQTEGP